MATGPLLVLTYRMQPEAGLDVKCCSLLSLVASAAMPAIHAGACRGGLEEMEDEDKKFSTRRIESAASSLSS